VPESSEPDRCRETARSLSSGHPCDVGSLSNGRRILRNGWRHGPQYSDRLSATADQTHLLPSFQPATGPRPVPAPLASELSGIDSHASLGLRAAKLAPPGHRGTFTPKPAGSPALHAVSSATCTGLRADVREVSVERASAFSGCSQGPLSRPRSSARCAGLSPMWRRHRAAAMTPRFRHTHRIVRPHDPSRQASLRKHRHGR
jgi:hypothetical protein